MKKILTVILGILLFIFPMTACKEKEETFNPDVPLLEAYDMVNFANDHHEDKFTKLKEAWGGDNNQDQENFLLAYDYAKFESLLKKHTYLNVKDLCNKSLFEENVVVFVAHKFTFRDEMIYKNFSFDGSVLAFEIDHKGDGFAVIQYYDLVVMPKPDNWDSFSSSESYEWSVSIHAIA